MGDTLPRGTRLLAYQGVLVECTGSSRDMQPNLQTNFKLPAGSSIDEMNYRFTAEPIERTSVTLQQVLMVDILVKFCEQKD